MKGMEQNNTSHEQSPINPDEAKEAFPPSFLKKHRWVFWVAIIVLVGLVLFANSKTYTTSFSEPVGHGGGDGYYRVVFPPKIFFYGKSRGIGGGELGPAVLTVKGADANTFQAVGRLYGKDKNHVYFVWRYFRNPPQIVYGADPESFVEMDPYYGHDAKTIYYGGYSLADSDPDDFKFLDSEPSFKYYGGNPRFVYSNGHVYYGTVKIIGAIRNSTYVVSRTVKPYAPCEGPSELRGGSFYLCKYPNVDVVDVGSVRVDPQTLQFEPYKPNTVPIDPLTFEIIEHYLAADGSYARDKNYVYYIDRSSCGVNQQGLTSCGGEDIQALYVVEGADIASFTNSNVNSPAKDKYYGTSNNFGYQKGCLLYTGAVSSNGETRNVLLQHTSPARPNVGFGGLCVYYTSDEDPR